jgi:hypothetical protein
MGGGMTGRGMMDGRDGAPDYVAHDVRSDGQQQRWTAYAGGDASVYARDWEIRSAAVGSSVDPFHAAELCR